MAFVLDASVALAWVFGDEASPTLLDRLPDLIGDPAAAPLIWTLEVANGLRAAERRGRCSAEQTDAHLADLDALPVTPDYEVPDVARLVMLSRRHDLTIYDASYLDLALRLARPLATLDRRLADAARAEGVPVLV